MPRNRGFRGIMLVGIWVAGTGVWDTVVVVVGWGVMEVDTEVDMEEDILKRMFIGVDIGDDTVDDDGGEGNIVLNVKLSRRGSMIIIIEGHMVHTFILGVEHTRVEGYSIH
jgi:hypothetical protein